MPSAESTVDYRALYEQAQAWLTAAEQTAAEHQAKAVKFDELEAANLTEAEKATGWADPTHAPRYVGPDGQIDTQTIGVDPAAVLLARPHLSRLARAESVRNPRRAVATSDVCSSGRISGDHCACTGNQT